MTAMHEAWLAGHQAHPSIAISECELAAFVGPRPIDGRHVADVYLACALAREDAAALAVFERTTLPAVERGLVGLKLGGDARRELLQVLREKMLVAKGIEAYDGRAPLAIWLRVCAARLAFREAGRLRRFVEIDDGELAQLAPGVPDPELTYLRRHYGAQFRAAFAHAVQQLAPRERNLLRHAVIDRLGIDQIAAIYHVHRATAARQLERARRALITTTRERMRETLGVSEAELDSILRALASVADVTLRSALARPRDLE
jgi:RNA polymerase sigma-70 factor (ECF subfamily)